MQYENKKIEATVLFVKDIKKAVNFYVEKLDLEKTEEQEDFANIKIGNTNIALLGPKVVNDLIGKKITNPGHSSLIAAEVEDLDKTYKELKSKRVNFIKEPKMQSWGQYTAYFTDQDG
ncbi:VOC family protein, partial [Patescibacteria group bacterium]|nr:VOC family protein [Patescibacteria group bacterium]